MEVWICLEEVVVEVTIRMLSLHQRDYSVAILDVFKHYIESLSSSRIM